MTAPTVFIPDLTSRTVAELHEERSACLARIAAVEERLEQLRAEAQRANFVAWLEADAASKPLAAWIRKHKATIQVLSDRDYLRECNNDLQGSYRPILLSVSASGLQLNLSSSNQLRGPLKWNLPGGVVLSHEALCTDKPLELSAVAIATIAGTCLGELLSSTSIATILRCFCVFSAIRADDLVTDASALIAEMESYCGELSQDGVVELRTGRWHFIARRFGHVANKLRPILQSFDMTDVNELLGVC